MTAHSPTAHEVETFTGRYVDTKNPKADTIALADIAHALSQTCRYGGHCQRFYSVAEHAVFVSRRLEAVGAPLLIQIAGLHHDDAEAYLGDIPRPMKGLLGKAYERLTQKMDIAVVWGLGLNDGGATGCSAADFHDPRVKDADNYALFVEAQHLLPSKGINWTGSFAAWDLDAAVAQAAQADITPDYWLGGVTPAIAKQLYIARHNELTGV